MALSSERRRELLAQSLPSSKAVREELADYLARTQLTIPDFARRINYSSNALWKFTGGRYEDFAANDANLRAAIHDFIALHPVALRTEMDEKLYETENVKLIRTYFYKALDGRRAYFIAGDPATQKTFVLKHLIAELNRNEIAKNGYGKRAYYIYCRHGIGPGDLMRRIAEATGSVATSKIERVLRNLRFDMGRRKVVFVFDEAQHLDVGCIETARELLDEPPYCGLLFAGSHEFDRMLKRNTLELEQWNSRFYAGAVLPGMTKDEAGEIARAELSGFSKEKTDALVRKCTARHFGNKGEYVSARRLFNSIRDFKGALEARKTGHQQQNS
jgi:DNA transposition AAA+ family ATPase